MIPLYHLKLRFSDINKGWDRKRGSMRFTKIYTFLNRLDLIQVHIVSEKNETETIHQQLNLFFLIKSQHSYNRIKIEILTMQNDY